MTEPTKPRNPWLLPSIAGAVALLSLFVPMSCNASANGTSYATQDGGPLALGALAIALAAWALTRHRRGAPAVIALIVAVAGGVQVARGVTLMKRVPSAAAQVDLDGAVRRTFEAMRDDHVEQIPGAGDATPDQLAAMRGLAHGYTRGLGRWQDISGLTRAPGEGDTVVATGTARYERGTPRFELTFRIVGGEPLITHLDLTIPADQLPPVADAEKAARQIAADIAAGAVDRVHDGIDPRLRSLDSIDAAIPKIHAVVAPSPAVELVSHTPCEHGECFELRFPVTGGMQRVRVTESSTFGIWLASSLTLGDG